MQLHLAEPLLDCLARDVNDQPCVDISSPLDLEAAVGMPGGNIFHGDLSWPWLADDEPADTPAQRYGVEIPGSQRVLLAGAGTRRGGGVSGLGGAAAVDALLETTSTTYLRRPVPLGHGARHQHPICGADSMPQPPRVLFAGRDFGLWPTTPVGDALISRRCAGRGRPAAPTGGAVPTAPKPSHPESNG